MHKFFILLLLLFLNFGKSQQITIKVKDSVNKPAENINVQLLKNNKTIEYKRTNKEGECVFNISENGVYSIKLTSVFYKSEIFDIDTNKNNSFEFSITANITEIENVEIKARPKIATAKEDTIAFNIKAIQDGTERTAEDLIKKIPGLNINENGKVSFNGNLIGQVLVDGNEFFGSNHKMATQNITADMLDGLELWQNYATINGNKSSALNFKLKDEYKGRITGNIETNYGSGNNYFAHTNLLKFNKIGNFALILDANNIAKDPISFMDFYEMNTQNQTDNSSEASTKFDVPSFLNNDGKLKSKDNQFYAFQYSKTRKNFKLTLYSILNSTRLKKASLTERISFPDVPIGFNFYENRAENNKGFFGTTQLNAKYSLSDDTFFYYNLGYNPTNDSFNQNINRRFFSENIDTQINENSKQFGFNNYLSFNTKWLDRFKIIIDFSQNKKSLTKNTEFFSNANLFGDSLRDLNQNFVMNTDEYTSNFYLKNKNKFLSFNFKSGVIYSKIESKNIYQEKNNFQKINSYNFVNELNVYKQIGNWDFSATLDWRYLDINQKTQNYFEKYLKLRFQPKTDISQEYAFEYKNSFENPNLKQLQNNPLFDKNISYSINTGLISSQLSNYNSFKWTYRRFNLTKGNTWLIMLLYDYTNSFFTTNTINFGTYTVFENMVGNMKDRFLGLLSNETRLKRFLSLKTKITALQNNTDNFILGKTNTTKIQNIEINQQLSTNFKKFPIQFDLGYIYNKSVFNQMLYQTKSSQENFRTLLGFRTNTKSEFILNILGEYLIQKTLTQKQKNFLLSGQFSYKKEKSNYEFNLKFNNLLSLDNFNYITNKTSEQGIEYTNISALKGYIIGGIKYYF